MMTYFHECTEQQHEVSQVTFMFKISRGKKTYLRMSLSLNKDHLLSKLDSINGIAQLYTD